MATIGVGVFKKVDTSVTLNNNLTIVRSVAGKIHKRIIKNKIAKFLGNNILFDTEIRFRNKSLC